MDKEQIIALAKKTGLYDYQPQVSVMKDFANAAIESYNAELLKEVQGGQPDLGEPIAWKYKKYSGGVYVSEHRWDKDQNLYDEEPLYTPDQVAAAILKATKPLEEEVERLKGMVSEIQAARHVHQEHNRLLTQLAAAQEEIRLLTERNATNEEYAANLVKALTKTQDQLAKAEQRVAEACASLCDHLQTSQKFGENGYGCEAAIRNGEWRKFVKEV